MSATLQATELAAGHGDRMLFSGLDLVVAAGDVVGLVGANGAGKSTLLRLLAGQATAQAGAVVLSPRARPRAPCRRNPTAVPARPCGRSWPGAPGWLRHSPRWIPRRRRWPGWTRLLLCCAGPLAGPRRRRSERARR